jgi:hypothetical protein
MSSYRGVTKLCLSCGAPHDCLGSLRCSNCQQTDALIRAREKMHEEDIRLQHSMNNLNFKSLNFSPARNLSSSIAPSKFQMFMNSWFMSILVFLIPFASLAFCVWLIFFSWF